MGFWNRKPCIYCGKPFSLRDWFFNREPKTNAHTECPVEPQAGK